MSTDTTAPAATAPDRSVELVNKLLRLPDEVKLDLGQLLLDSVKHGFTSLEESAKRDKELIRSRLEELVSGKAILLTPDDMFAEMRRRVAEVRKK